MAAVIIFFSFVLTFVPLVAFVLFFAHVVGYENGHYDHRRAEPYHLPYHPEFHTQLRGRELD